MSAETKPVGIDPEVMANLEAAAHYAATGECDPQTLRRIAERAAQARWEVEQRTATESFGAAIIREMRDSR